jgi:hypothetical protein
MARPARPHPGASGVTRYASVPDPGVPDLGVPEAGFPDAGFPDPGIPDAGSGWAADIVELIMADHRRIERLCRTLYDTARYDRQPRPDWMPGHVWQRLADLLVAHTQAEEQTCYASASCAGRRTPGRCGIRSPTTMTSGRSSARHPRIQSDRRPGGMRSGP